MQKSTLIATCLFNSAMVPSLDVGERIVRDVFEESFNGKGFSQWDAPMPAMAAKSIIDGVGRAMRIDVRKFIADLAAMPEEPDSNQDRSSASDEPAEPSFASGVFETSGKRFNGRT